MKERNLKLLALSIMIGQSVLVNSALSNELLSSKIQSLGSMKIKSKVIEQLPEETRTQIIEITDKAPSLDLTKSEKKVIDNLRKQTEKAKKHSPKLFQNDTSTTTAQTENVPSKDEVEIFEEHSETSKVLEEQIEAQKPELIELKTKSIEEENIQEQARTVQASSFSVKSVNMNLAEVPYFVKIYKNNVDDYQDFIESNMNDNDGFSFKFSANSSIGESIINDKITYDNNSPQASFGIQNKLNDNFKVSFDTMYKEQKYDLNEFKDVKDKLLFISANAEGKTKFFDLNTGYIFSNKLNSDINKSGNDGLYGKLDNINQRFFATIGKKFEVYNNLYLSTNVGANFDIIGMKNFKVSDNYGNSTEIKDKNNFLVTETFDVLLNKEFSFLDDMKLNLFAGTNFNFGNKTINMKEKNGDSIAKFKLKNYNYFVGGLDFKLNDKFGLKATYKNNLSKSKDNQVNLGINMNI